MERGGISSYSFNQLFSKKPVDGLTAMPKSERTPKTVVAITVGLRSTAHPLAGSYVRARGIESAISLTVLKMTVLV